MLMLFWRNTSFCLHKLCLLGTISDVYIYLLNINARDGTCSQVAISTKSRVRPYLLQNKRHSSFDEVTQQNSFIIEINDSTKRFL